MRVVLSAVVLGLAWFAVINLAVSAMTWLAARLIDDRITPSTGRSRVLLALRFAPAVVAAAGALGIFVPGHLWLEPPQVEERHGVVIVALASLSLLLFIRSGWQVAAVIVASRRLSSWASGRVRRSRGVTWTELPVLSGISLAGVIRARVIVGTEVRRTLTSGELEVAVAHELAHQRALDNLTRVLMACVPDLLGLTGTARRLERLWNGHAECLADARAVDGDPRRASQLASALIKVARLHATLADRHPAWSSFHQPDLLETRVRLLVDQRPRSVRAGRGGSLMLFALTPIVVTAAWAVELPSTLHHLTELLIAALP